MYGRPSFSVSSPSSSPAASSAALSAAALSAAASSSASCQETSDSSDSVDSMEWRPLGDAEARTGGREGGGVRGKGRTGGLDLEVEGVGGLGFGEVRRVFDAWEGDWDGGRDPLPVRNRFFAT